MFRLKMSILLSMLALLGVVNVSAAGSDHPDAATVRAALGHRRASSSAAVESQAGAAKVSALLAYSMLGTGTWTLDDMAACPGVVCNASNGGCVCYTFQGKLNATQVGNGTWTSNVTVNVDDCTNTGTQGPNGGFCCFGGGVLSAKTGNNTLAMSLTGPVCSDPNANGQTTIQQGFIIVTANSTGKFLHSAGTGQLNFFVADDGTSYLAGNGVLQLVSPF